MLLGVIFILNFANRIDPEMLKGVCITTSASICSSPRSVRSFLEKLLCFSTFISPHVPSGLCTCPDMTPGRQALPVDVGRDGAGPPGLSCPKLGDMARTNGLSFLTSLRLFH